MKPGSPTALLQSLTMTDQTAKALAIWKAKTESEQVEWIAVEIMKWAICGTSKWYEPNTDYVRTAEATWNPLTNWNDWRQVEEKIMEDVELWEEMMEQNHQLPNKRSFDVYSYWFATLPRRCSALYLAYTSLHPTL